MISEKNIQDYVAEVQVAANDYIVKMGFTRIAPDQIEYSTGRKFAKIISVNNQRTVISFINLENGDIHFPKSWKSASKSVRGNIFNAEKPKLGSELYVR